MPMKQAPINQETPYLLLDINKLDANIARMKAHLAPLNVTLRPHVKTNKSAQVADRFFNTADRPITVSTLHEADFFAQHGFTDILYGVAIAPNKFEHVRKLISEGIDLKLILDNVQTAQLLLDFSSLHHLPIKVLLEIDSDGHRSGLPPCDAEIEQIVGLLQGSLVTICGVMTHAGNSYNSRSLSEIEQYANQERDAVVSSAEMLRSLGVNVTIVSVGSTPTALFCKDLTGVTEVRAGVFAFFDLVMAGLGVCKPDDIALSVVTMVIGHQKEKGWVIVDAGWMALSRDRGTANQKVDQGYGIVCDINGRPIGDLIVSAANQEHGIISSRSGKHVDGLPVGTQLRILPNHACSTAAQYSGYYLLNLDESADTYWPRINGWQ
ncbi:alanine racemase [Budviciaceae bacterium CWB-B4]|uniref:Alanine racemase n=1 Tax=Limnobaculum xujianqingii TaxID=2738837 RepID=A0A9D7AHS9_9GAMM|nr:alanine racemase [Limnobaculum xujianqingii]MBK5072996.1 alanine racemase [Limnobaculum xujianqingii]MBK5176305.1 alanine racemase [Limnobaculum xujianqingii]